MTPCEELEYSEGELFEVIDAQDLNHEYVTEGMFLTLHDDDGSKSPGFKYVSGDKTKFTDAVEVIYLSIYSVKKIIKFKVPEIDKTDNTDKTTEVTYSVQDIEAAFEHLSWLDSSKDILFEALRVVTDSEYKEYLRLKLKYETK